MARFERLVLHIGDTKAGSTTLQHVLTRGRDGAMGFDIAFPGRDANHNAVADALRAVDGGPGPAECRRRLARFRADLRAAPSAACCVISAENLSFLAPARLREFIEAELRPHAGRIEIVHYLRPHVARMRSGYAESVKIGLEFRPFPDFVQQTTRQGRFCRSGVVQACRETFGDAYIPRPLIRAHLVGGDIVTDFLALATGAAQRPPQAPSLNQSLDCVALGEIQRLQSGIRTRSRGLRHAVGYEFARRYARQPSPVPTPRLGILPRAAGRLDGRYRRDAIALDRALGLTADGFSAALDRDLQAAQGGVANPQDLPPNPAALAASRGLRRWLALPLPDRVLAALLARRGALAGAGSSDP
ncbi:hypothetical protein [Paracoccus spongiarum]|uniref:Uncharacterized protein n=1 Tax=Paracoccus spongiarum TaxID=3064387 RepID=A0ABT9JCX8_9RHOB|nr:hypothetical protein [Paracoccus sp. 2205BS29-5]MDP5307689.1 hypothetical protein [Paracoccus sp. 2205BS29-5]